MRSDGEGIVGGDGDRVNSGWGTVGGAMACDRNGTCTEMIVTGDTCDSAQWLVTEVVPVMEMACEMQVTCFYNGVVCDR